jgi:folate-binding protein YgfZ
MTVATQSEQPAGINENRRELTALIAGCGVYRTDKALFSLTGRDRVRWLNGMVTNNIRDLAPGNGVYAFVLNAQGNILGDLYVFSRGESLVAEIERERAENVIQILRRYIIMDKVEVEDLSGKMTVLGIAGPKSCETLAAIGLRADLNALQIAEVTWKDVSITLLRRDNPCVPIYELWIPGQKVNALSDALAQVGAESVSQESLETFRILCGIPKIGQDIKERTLPQETGQDRALNFTKGCYIGQEIVERIRARGAVHRTFIGFEIDGEASAGTKVQSEGKDVGEITSVVASPFQGKRLGVGFLRREFLDKKLVAGQSELKAVRLPFLEARD